MLAKDHQPYRNRALEETVKERDEARKELISRIEQVAQLTADCRGYRERLEWWKKLAEDREEVLAPIVAERDRLSAVNKTLVEASQLALALIKDNWIEEDGNEQVGRAWQALDAAIAKAKG